MQITCTNGSPIVDTLDHLPPLPLFIDYWYGGWGGINGRDQDESGIYHTLRLHGPSRIRHINLDLPPSILHKVVVLMDKHFSILEHLALSFTATIKNSHPLTLALPKAFQAPNLRHLTLPSISPPRRLRFLTSTVSLVTLELRNIQTSSYFGPKLLVARLQSLTQLEELSLEFSIPIPRPSTERELLGVQKTPVTLPSLKTLSFHGVGAYLESLVAQIRVPLLERLSIRLFNQIAFVLPHLFYLINITKLFKLSNARVGFHSSEVCVSTIHDHSSGRTAFSLRVMCNHLDWQVDCAAQICHALIPTLSGVEELTLSRSEVIPTEVRNGGIDSATWHDLLRPFIGVQRVYIADRFLEELSRALQADEVGSDPGFIPNLRSIHAGRNLFTSFIDTRQVVVRPVEFSLVVN